MFKFSNGFFDGIMTAVEFFDVIIGSEANTGSDGGAESGDDSEEIVANDECGVIRHPGREVWNEGEQGNDNEIDE